MADTSERRSLLRQSGSLPWNQPLRDWFDEELERGLKACDEHDWKNLRRNIVGEQNARIGEERAA